MVRFFLIFLFSISLQAVEVIPVAIIGSGPAGLSAALVTTREKVSTTIFTGPYLGGPLNAKTCCGNWPGSMKGKGDVVLERLLYQVRKGGGRFIEQEVTSVDFSSWPYLLQTKNGDLYRALSVVIALGSLPRMLGCEEKYLGRGVETSVYKTDAESFRGKKVVVVGGGLDAKKKTSILSKTAESVLLVVRGSSMQKPEWQMGFKENVQIATQTEVIGVLGNEQTLTHILLSNGKKVPCDALVLAIGIVPNTDLFKGQLPLDENGRVILQERTQKTPLFGVFAAGTVSDGRYRQAGISAGDGMKAGYDALHFLQTIGHSWSLSK